MAPGFMGPGSEMQPQKQGDELVEEIQTNIDNALQHVDEQNAAKAKQALEDK